MHADEEGTRTRERGRGGGTGRRREKLREGDESNCDGGEADAARAEDEDDGDVENILRPGSADSEKVGDTLQFASSEAMIRLLPPSSSVLGGSHLK